MNLKNTPLKGMSEFLEAESEASRAGAAYFLECGEVAPEEPLPRSSQSALAKRTRPSSTEAT